MFCFLLGIVFFKKKYEARGFLREEKRDRDCIVLNLRFSSCLLTYLSLLPLFFFFLVKDCFGFLLQNLLFFLVGLGLIARFT